MSNNQNPRPEDEMHDSAKQAGKKVGKQVSNKGKELGKQVVRKATEPAKKALKKIAAKLGKQALKLAGKALLKLGLALIKALFSAIMAIGLPALIVIAIVAVLAAIWYLIDLEDDGNEQVYYDNNNETKVVNAGSFVYKKNEGNIYGKNAAMKDFYIKVAQESFWQILPDKRKLHEDGLKLDKLELFIDTGKSDFYQKEKQLYLNSTLLFLLDDYLNEGYFIYPEQFTKPVYANGKTMKLQSLLNENKSVVTTAKEYYYSNNKDGKEAGTETGREIKSVANHGLASILLYKEDELIKTVEGTVTDREYYDKESNQIIKQSINEKFAYELPGSPEEILLIEKASTIDGLITYEYERKKEPSTALSGESSERASLAAKVLIDTVPEYELQRTEEVVVNEETGEEETIVTEEYVKTGRMLDLYEYRTGFEYLDKPVEKDKDIQKLDFDYLEQYILNYEAIVPMSVMKGFDFEERMDGYAVGGTISDLLNNLNLEVGSKTNTQFYKENYAKYFSIFQKYTAIYGGDPYLLLAKMMLESGGNPNLNADGLMQIVGGTRSVTAVRLDGTSETMQITVPEKKDPDKSIKFAVMFNKTKLDKFDGNSLKALQAYNFDVSGVFKDKWPDLWATDTDWIDFNKIEEARKILAAREGYAGYKSANTSCGITSTGSGLYGNTCYIPMVLQYYAGSSVGLASSATGGKTPTSQTALAGGDASKNTYDKTVKTKSSTTAQSNAKKVVNPDSYLVVVNKDNKLESSYTPSDLTAIKGVTTKGNIRMRSEAASAIEKMIKAAKSDGVDLGVYSGFRSYQDQEAAFKKHNDESISAKAGYSEHQTGLAADIVAKDDVNKDSTKVLVSAFGDTKEGKWLKKNGAKYGFIIRYLSNKTSVTGYSYEPWHVRYVGLENAKIIADRSITLEEAIAQGLLSGQEIDGTKPLPETTTGGGDSSSGGEQHDLDVDLEKEEKKEGFLKKMFNVIFGNNYKEETKFYNFKNHIGAKEMLDIKKQYISYQKKEPYSLINLDDDSENLTFVGSLDNLSSSGSTTGTVGGGGNITPGEISTEGFSSPLNLPSFRVSSRYGPRDIGYGNENHQGVDAAIPTGTPIYSIGEGVVSYVEPYKGEGNIYTWGWGSVIFVDHPGGVRSIYAHLSATYVTKDTPVSNGTLLGASGNTGRSFGAHLHFEMRKLNSAGKWVPFDPYNILMIGKPK